MGEFIVRFNVSNTKKPKNQANKVDALEALGYKDPNPIGLSPDYFRVSELGKPTEDVVIVL